MGFPLGGMTSQEGGSPRSGKAAAPAPTAWAVSRWWDEPWSRGGWSLLRVGGSPASRRQLGEPIDGRLVLAGEATHPEQSGMTHGAYEEGARAARWCLQAGHHHVVVVGAGAAGLGAARTLADAGARPVVVEARDRIGGRIHTVDVGGVAAELGANWLQQGARNSLAPIAERLGLALVDTDFHHPLDLDPIGVVDRTADDAIAAELQRRLAGLGEPDRPLADVIEAWCADPAPWTPAAIRRVVDGEVYLDTGAPLDELSARHGVEPGVGEGDRWVVGGYRQVLDELARGLDVRLGWPVGRIARTPQGVSVHGPAGSLAADAVVVTVPAAVLGAGVVGFEPPLPATHLESLRLLTTGRVEKVVLRFDRRWWPVSPSRYLRVLGERGGQVSEWLDVTDTVGAPMITGLFVGSWVSPMWDGRTDAEVARAASAVLHRAATAAGHA